MKIGARAFVEGAKKGELAHDECAAADLAKVVVELAGVVGEEAGGGEFSGEPCTGFGGVAALNAKKDEQPAFDRCNGLAVYLDRKSVV